MDICKPFCGGVSQKFLLPHYNWKVMSRLLGCFTKILQKNCREFFSRQSHIKRKSDITQTSFFVFGYWYLIFYAMSLLLNVAIPIKNKNAVIEIPNMAVVKTLLTVKDVKDFSNRKLSGKSPFTKFAILPLVDYCFLKTSFIIFVNFGGVP